MEFRERTLRIAHELVTYEGFSMSEAMSQAWKAYRLRRDMHKGTVEFAYYKVDGTIREAVGTLQNTDHLIKGTGEYSPTSLNFKYYDLEAKAFRSFKISNLL